MAVSPIELGVRSPIPINEGVDQHVSAYTRNGRKQWVKLTPQQPSGSLRFEDLQPGDSVYLTSDRVFSPAWQGGADARILSFELRVGEGSGGGEGAAPGSEAGIARAFSRLFKGCGR